MHDLGEAIVVLGGLELGRGEVAALAGERDDRQQRRGEQRPAGSASAGRRAAYDRTESGLACWLATHGLPASSETYTKPPVASVASGTAIETG